MIMIMMMMVMMMSGWAVPLLERHDGITGL
jgi:hypothetical protein